MHVPNLRPDRVSRDAVYSNSELYWIMEAAGARHQCVIRGITGDEGLRGVWLTPSLTQGVYNGRLFWRDRSLFVTLHDTYFHDIRPQESNRITRTHA